MNIRTERGLFGQYINYQDGKKVGEVWPGLFERSYNIYDADGNYKGYTDRGIIADRVTYDDHNEFVASSHEGMFGALNHYDSDGYMGTTVTGMFGYDTELDEGGF